MYYYTHTVYLVKYHAPCSNTSMTKEEEWLLREKYAGVAGPGFEADKGRLAAGEPLAYVIGWQPFLGLKIYLDSKPLIPRTETEWWVEECIGEVRRRQSQGRARSGPLGQVLPPSSAPSAPTSLRLLDLCAGSGAIGCAVLKHFPTAQVSFGEIDPAHGATIRKNIQMNDLRGLSYEVCIGDLFEPFKGRQFDWILANPPYIPEGRELPASVAGYEPELALYSGEDGLDLMRRIARELPSHLKKGGQAWVECDSPAAEAAAELFRERGLEARVMHDQYARPRVIVISWPQ
jgi:release factor glutamine methyltransferase